MHMLFFILACSVPTSDFEIFGGFHFEWDRLSHRVSRIEASVGGESGPAMAMVGGDWSTGEAFSDFLHYRLPSLEVRNAKAALGQVRVAFTLSAPGLPEEGEEVPDSRPDQWATATARIPIDQVGGWEVYTALIQGFGVRSDVEQSADFPENYDAANGYALGRLAVKVGQAERSDTEVLVPVSIQFVPGDTEEAILDRPAMNSSIPFAQFQAWVEVGVVGHLRQGTEFPAQAVGSHPYAPPYSDQPATRVAMDFPDNRLALWQSLSFEANPLGPGDYIRSIGAELVGEERVRGADLDFGNSSVYELHAFNYSVQGQLALIDLGRNAQIYLRSREGEAEVGEWAP
jgi:hypothetical protein